jgi:flavin-dependent dehydrogenase
MGFMEHYDVVVVGAGPAGCNFISSLDSDYHSLLLDRKALPATKVCGGLLTEESMQFLQQHHNLPPDEVFSSPKKLDKYYVNLDNGGEEIKNGFVYNTNRDLFNRWLFSQIPDSTVVLEKACLDSVIVHTDEIILSVHDEKTKKEKQIQCSYLIGADGVHSKIRSILHTPPTTKGMAIQELGIPTNNLDRLIFFFYKELNGYFVWAMPKAESILIGVPQPSDDKKINEKILVSANQIVERYLTGSIKMFKREGHLVTIPQSADELCLGRGHILLIGEAAGWMSARSGDGISFALRSSYQCAEAFNRSPENILQMYERNTQRLRGEFIDKLPIIKGVEE